VLRYYFVGTTTTAEINRYWEPWTPGGMLTHVLLSYLGLFILCFPTAIIGRNFSQQYEDFFKGWHADELWYSSDEDEGEHDEGEGEGEGEPERDADGGQGWGNFLEDYDDFDGEEKEPGKVEGAYVLPPRGCEIEIVSMG
jgi:hypothetical protein